MADIHTCVACNGAASEWAVDPDGGPYWKSCAVCRGTATQTDFVDEDPVFFVDGCFRGCVGYVVGGASAVSRYVEVRVFFGDGDSTLHQAPRETIRALV